VIAINFELLLNLKYAVCVVAKMNSYSNFLNLLQGILQLDKFPTMTPLSRLILDQIALYEFSGKPLTVRELIMFDEIASPATLHKHLSFLRSSEYVIARSERLDKRTKLLVLSPLGIQYVNDLSKAIVQAAAT